MKRKAIIFLLCVTMSFAAGCGDKQKNVADETEITDGAVSQNDTDEMHSSDFEYDIEDYVTLGDYMDVEVTVDKSRYKVTRDAVNTYAEQIIAYYVPYVPDESKTVVEKGDIVDVDYVGKLNGEAFEGGSATGQLIDTGANSNVTMGSGYIDGFSDGLIGAKVGDTVDSEVTFPEDYYSEDLKGKDVTFTFTINSIDKAMTLEQLDDAFVAENLNAENVEDFYKHVREDVTQQMKLQEETELRTAVMNEVVKKNKNVSFPAGLLEARVEEYIEDFQAQYCTGGVTLEDFVSANYGMTEEDFRSQCESYVGTALKQELIFEAIAKKENIPFDEEEFEEYAEAMAGNNGYASVDAMYEKYGSSKESGKKYLQKVYLQNKAVEMIAEQATINYTEEAQTETDDKKMQTEERLEKDIKK